MQFSILTYSHFLETILDAVLVVRGEGEIVLANSSAQALFGFQSGEFQERSLSSIISPEYIQEFLIDPQAYATGIIKKVAAQREDGSEFSVEIRFQPVELDQTKFTVCTIREIADQNQTEQALSMREQVFRTLVENTPDLLVRYDKDLHKIYMNPAWEKVSGLSAEDFTNKFAADVPNISSSVADEIVAKLRQVLETGTPQQLEFTWVNAYGEPLFLEYVIVPEYDQDGNVDGALAVGHDLTARKQMEEALRTSEQKFRSFIEESSEGLTLADEQGRIIEWNQARERMTGLEADQVIGRYIWDVLHQMMPNERQTPENYERNKQTILDALETGQSPIFKHVIDAEVMRPDGERQFVQQTIFPIKTDKGYRFGSVTIDITDRKRIEEKLRASEERLQLALDAAKMGQWEWNIVTGEVEWSQQCLALNGLPPNTPMNYEKFLQTLHPEDRDSVNAALELAVEERTSYDETKRTIWPDGTTHWTTSRGQVYCDAAGEPIHMTGVTFDTSKWKEAEEERQAHLQFLESMDQVNRAIQGTNDLEQMMRDVLDIVLSIFDCDRAFLMYPCDPDAPSWNLLTERTRPEYPGVLSLGMDEMPIDADLASKLRILLAADGPVKFGPGTSYPLPVDVSTRFGFKSFMSMALHPKIGKPWQFGIHQCSHQRNWTPEEERLFEQIGRRLSDSLTSLLAYRNLQESEERYRLIAENTADTIVVYDLNLQPVYVSPSVINLSGFTPQETMKQSIDEYLTPESQQIVEQVFSEQIALEESGNADPARTFLQEVEGYRKDGSTVWIEVAASFLRDSDFKPTGILTVLRDITERKRAEEDLRKLSHAIEQSPASIIITNISGDIEYVNPKFSEVSGYTNDEVIGKNPSLLKSGETPPEEYQKLWNTITHGGVWRGEFHNKKKDGELYWESASISPVIDSQGNIQHFVAVKEDITARKQAEEMAAHRLAELEAISKISTNLRGAQTRAEILQTILAELLDVLKARGAEFIMRDPASSTTVVELAVGEFSPEIGNRLSIGEGVSGHVIQTGQPYLNNDAHSDLLCSTPNLLKHITSMACVPLIAHEKTIGAVWIGRSDFINEHEMRLLMAIADMAANAIHRATLHELTQQDALELALAYDTTIEGWSRALDLRDRETEGHTQRVTEMTLRLARLAGMTEEELVHVKRGALLHDIGKMGIPDNILHKPDKLTEEEWAIMRRHPTLAYEMLAPIEYLELALDIPYCHHEHWDGSGYPRGLKGTQIPLAARIFAVVDVWDALRFDRPYRNSWSQEKTFAHIREQAGKYFDPEIVELFFTLMNETD